MPLTLPTLSHRPFHISSASSHTSSPASDTTGDGALAARPAATGAGVVLGTGLPPLPARGPGGLRRHRSTSSGEMVPSGLTHAIATTESTEEPVHDDDMCCFDWALLCEPVTLFCGHTFCRHCVSILLEDAASKGHSPEGSMKCPLCCRALPAVLPEPNVRLRNDLRARYPVLYEQRLASVREEYGPEGCFKPKHRSACLTAEDLREMLAYRRRLRRQQAAANGGEEDERRRMAEEDGPEDDLLLDDEDDEDLDEAMDDPVLETVELFQSQLLHIWRRRRPLCWVLACVVLVLGFTPLRQAPMPTKAAYVDSILRVESWRQWWTLSRLSDLDHCGLERPDPGHSPFPGSELLATVLMYPSWGWVERVARGLEGTVVDAYRVLSHPSPATLISAFPGLAMAGYALCHPGWSPLFREAVAFVAIEGEVRQLMALLTILTIPTRIPRDPRDIPALPQMPVYAWTVLSLSLAQGAYLLVCNMISTLLDIAALAPLILGMSHGLYWRSEASLAALLATRVWFMLREDLGLFRRWLGSKPRAPLEATAVRLVLGLVVVCTHCVASTTGRNLFNPTDLVSTLANAGDAIVHELMDEMDKAVTTALPHHNPSVMHQMATSSTVSGQSMA